MALKQGKPKKRKPQVEPWLQEKLMELNEDPAAVRVYLLVDEKGAKQVAAGIVPEYLRLQAQRMLRGWSTE